MLAGAFNPFSPALTVVGATVETPGAGTATVTGDAVAVRPAADFIGTMVTRYTVRDATGDPARAVEGRVTVIVRGRPGTPVAPRVTEVRDGAVVLAWDAPVAHGEPITGYRVTASPGGARPRVRRDDLYGRRPDQRHRVHVHGRGPQRGRLVAGERGVGARAARTRSRTRRSRRRSCAGTGQVTASWTAPRSPGSPVDLYTVEVSPVPPAGASLTTTGTSVTVRGPHQRRRVRRAGPRAQPCAGARRVERLVRGRGAGRRAGRARTDRGPARHRRPQRRRPARRRLGRAVTTTAPRCPSYEVAVDGTTVAVLPASTTSWTFDGAERGRAVHDHRPGPERGGLVGLGQHAGSRPGARRPSPATPTATDVGGTDVPWGQGSVVLTWQPPADAGGTGISVAGYEVEGLGRTAATSMTVSGLTAGVVPDLPRPGVELARRAERVGHHRVDRR